MLKLKNHSNSMYFDLDYIGSGIRLECANRWGWEIYQQKKKKRQMGVRENFEVRYGYFSNFSLRKK